METYLIILLPVVCVCVILVLARYLRITKSKEMKDYYRDVIGYMEVRDSLLQRYETNSELFAKLTWMSKFKLMVGWYTAPPSD
jgi:hypothetical protein